jgi:hypothetical protein
VQCLALATAAVMRSKCKIPGLVGHFVLCFSKECTSAQIRILLLESYPTPQPSPPFPSLSTMAKSLRPRPGKTVPNQPRARKLSLKARLNQSSTTPGSSTTRQLAPKTPTPEPSSESDDEPQTLHSTPRTRQIDVDTQIRAFCHLLPEKRTRGQ